jgi:hypothetical protein
MKEITLAEFNKLPKKGPISGSRLNPGTMYYIHDRRNDSNPVYIGKYVGPVKYYNDNNVMVNYKFDDVKYLVNSSKYRNAPRGVFGSLEQYFEVVVEPTASDIGNKKTTMKELQSFINEKKAEPHDISPKISFMGKDYRKVRDKFYNRFRSSSLSSLSSSSAKRSKRMTPNKSSSSSRKRYDKKSSRRSSSSYRTSSSSSSRRRTRRSSRR